MECWCDQTLVCFKCRDRQTFCTSYSTCEGLVTTFVTNSPVASSMGSMGSMGSMEPMEPMELTTGAPFEGLPSHILSKSAHANVLRSLWPTLEVHRSHTEVFVSLSNAPERVQ